VDVVEVGGLRVAFERRGTGPPLVLLHGILQDGRAWRPQLDALSDERKPVQAKYDALANVFRRRSRPIR